MTEEIEELEIVEIPKTLFYINVEGEYLGGYSEGNPAIPVGAIEVETPPPHAWQKYDRSNSAWLPLTADQIVLLPE